MRRNKYIASLQSDKFEYCVSSAVMKSSDSATIASGTSACTLMQAVAQAITCEINNISNDIDIIPNRGVVSIAIVCGSGNNGGDGHALAQLLAENDYHVTVFHKPCISEESRYFQDKVASDERIEKRNILSLSEDYNDNNYSITVDCLHGVGFCCDVREEYISVIDFINKGKFIIACDIPSGLNSDNGILSNACVNADITIAVQAVKTGHLLNDGKDYCGVIKVADIGIEIVGDVINVVNNNLFNKCFNYRLQNSHKGTYGNVGIVACSKSSVGAGLLSATACQYAMCYRDDAIAIDKCKQYKSCRDCEIYVERAYNDANIANNSAECALRVGAGLCKLFVPPYMFDTMYHRLNHATLHEYSQLKDSKLSAIAFGMGVGSDCDMLQVVLDKNIPTVIDADGLNILSRDVSVLDNRCNDIIITPHPLEFSRLTGLSVAEILADPIRIAKNFAKTHNIIVVLKGCSSIVTNGVDVSIVTSGSPAMAKAGAGDVLSGVIAGLLAQKITPFNAVRLGSYILGLAGECMERKYGQYAVLASDMSRVILEVMVDLSKA